MIVPYKPAADSVIEPNLLDMLPAPADCDQQQREMAIGWYVRRDLTQLGEYLRNTQQRIYREYYGNPRKRIVGNKLYNLYAMRDIIHEAMRRKGARTFGTATPALDAIVQRSQTTGASETTSNYIPLERLDVRSVGSATTS